MLRHFFYVVLLCVPSWPAKAQSRKTIADMDCKYIRQPLNHLALPRDDTPHYNQRYCVFEFASVPNASTPVLFYTGNESPLDTYINHTGLLWQIAEELQATVLFAEHRYEGQSLPPPDIPNCLAYASSVQAIADYARLIELHYKPRPVIVFGGSYGGMLSAWMRMQYPHLVAGAIAASAPIWGLPLTSDRIDGASKVILHGLRQSYPPRADLDDTKANHSNFCAENLRAAWPLMQVLGRSQQGLQLLTSSFSMCSPLQQQDVPVLINWAQSPWFDLAEGSFPYPSSYIPFALTHRADVLLPAWPLQFACSKTGNLHQDLGIRWEGNVSDNTFRVQYGDKGLSLDVDWDKVDTINHDEMAIHNSGTLRILLTSVRDAVSTWFNMTKDVVCYNLTAAPSRNVRTLSPRSSRWKEASLNMLPATKQSRRWLSVHSVNDGTALCDHRMRTGGSWPALFCNDEMNLIITEARGMGKDMFWPPSHPRGTLNHADIVAYNQANNLTVLDDCLDPAGAFGFPKGPMDPWSTWLDMRYGGSRISSHSNIIFSNGLLDPWSSAGVYSVHPDDPSFERASTSPFPGVVMQNISGHSMVALVMALGGHHTDLMYDDSSDPLSIRYAREIERTHISDWIKQWLRKRHIMCSF